MKGNLDVDNPQHISDLQAGNFDSLKLEYIPKINDALYTFIHNWNHHPVSTCGNKPPVRMFYDGLKNFENSEELRDSFLKRI